MRIYVVVFLAVLHLLVEFSSSFPSTNIISVKQGEGVGGFWKNNIQWKAHWVKQWQVRKIYVPVWRKVWGPVDVREWIPLPKPPPQPVL